MQISLHKQVGFGEKAVSLHPQMRKIVPKLFVI